MDIYLDNAATSHPKPPCVVEAVVRALTQINGNPGRSGHKRAIAGAEALMECRQVLARMLAAPDPMAISFAFNCTDALNLAIKGCLQPGDHVVSTRLEHNAVLRPLMTLQEMGLVEVTLADPAPDGFVTPEALRAALKKRTRLCVVGHASNVTGAIQPVAAIGGMLWEAGVPYLIDGAQALGIQPVDVGALRCAMYAFPGHKGLLGPQGTGGLYLDPGFALGTLREGGTGSSSESMLQPQERPERYESGTMNLHGIAGLLVGAQYVLENELRLRAQERTRTAQLMEGLLGVPGITLYGDPDPRNRVGVVSFNVGDEPSGAVADALDRLGFAVRGGLHCAPGIHSWLGTLERGAVRASPGHATTAQEIDLFVEAVRRIAREGSDRIP